MPGAQVIELLASWIVTNALTFAVVIFDERRMTEERLERAWPASSRDAAIVGFGLIALPIHFARTRGSFRSARGVLGIVLGLALGVIAAVVVAVVASVVLTGVYAALGLPSRE